MNGALRSFFSALPRRRVAVGSVAAVVVVLAGVTLLHMPLQLLPEVRYPQVRVIGDLPGQTSAVIEESINEPLEASLASTPRLVRMESRSGDGRSYVDLFFEPGHDMDRALREVSQGVQRARSSMPAGLPEPRVFEVATSEEPAMQFAFGSDRHTASELRQRLRSNLLPRLRRIGGVDMVFIGREEDPELVVEINPRRQMSLDVSFEAVEDVLLRATSAPLSGNILTSAFEGVGVSGESDWDPRSLMERTLRSGHTEVSLPLKAFAQAFRAPSETSLRTRLNGASAVLVTVHRSPRAQALRTASEVRSAVETVMRGRAFEDVEHSLLFDDSVVTAGAVRSVLVAASVGSLLAMGLVFLALRQGRKVLLVGCVVITSLSAAVLALAGAGMTLNLLTLAGLLISVGLGLDYAIIYFDRMDRLRGDSNRPEVDAMLDVAAPLLGALLTTVAAVAPFLLVSGLVAELFQPLILTVISSSVFAYVSALLILPAFAGTGGARRAESPKPLKPWSGRFWHASQRVWVVWPVFFLLLGGLLVVGRTLPFEVLPVVDDGFVDVRIVHPVGIPPDAMDELTREVERALMRVEGTSGLFTTVGGYFREGLPSFRPGTANFMVRVDTDSGRRPSSAWADDAREAIVDLGIPVLNTRIQLPRIRGVRTRLSEADVEVILTRPDGDLLALAEAEILVEEALAGVGGLVDAERVRGGVSPRWRVEPRYSALSQYGVSLDDLEKVVAYTMEGTVLRERMENGDPLALRVRYDRRMAGGPQHLEQAVVPAGAGRIHLAEIAGFNLIEEPTHIERRENQRIVRIGAQLDPAGPGPGRVAADVETTLAALDLPDDVSWWLEGEIEALEETRRTFALSLALALFIVFVILAVQYGSLRHAFAGWAVIPLCGFGTLVLLWIARQPLDAMVLAGLLISVGIVANSMILVLSEADWRLSAQSGEQPDRALAYAGRSRLRPISLTVASTTLGMSPLLFGGSEVFGLLQPLAIALTGALFVSVPVACILLPGILRSFGMRRL